MYFTQRKYVLYAIRYYNATTSAARLGMAWSGGASHGAAGQGMGSYGQEAGRLCLPAFFFSGATTPCCESDRADEGGKDRQQEKYFR